MARESSTEPEISSDIDEIPAGNLDATTSFFTAITSKIKIKIYKYCYITGARLMQKTRRFGKKAVAYIGAHRPHLHTSGRYHRIFTDFSVRFAKVKEPFDEGFSWTLKLNEEYHAAVENGSKIDFYKKSAKSVMGYCAGNFPKIFNYTAPIAAIFVFMSTVGYYNNLTIALSVEYAGDHIGFVRSEGDFDTADHKMRERIVFEEYVHPEDAIPKFTLKVINTEQLSSEEQLTDKMLASSGSELTEAYGLYISNKFVGASQNDSSIESMLGKIKEEYRTGDPDEEVEFTKPVEIKEGLYPLTSIVNTSRLEQEIGKDEFEQRIYTVQKGDAPTLIAQKYDMLYADLKALNPNIEKSLMVGQEVLIERSVPMLGVQVRRMEVYNEEVPFKIERVQDANLNQGYTKVSQMGQKGLNEITAEVIYIDGVEQERRIVSTVTVKETVNEKMVVGGKTPLAQLPSAAMSTDSNFIWPVDGGKLTCDFYGYYNHGGMDIGAQAGTAVRASASGTVVLAVPYTTNGYGKYVIIDHGGGVQTLYGHNSKLHVNAGDWVSQGQLIASVGSTGNSYGNHCHFEIRINKVQKNPAQYIGTAYNR